MAMWKDLEDVAKRLKDLEDLADTLPDGAHLREAINAMGADIRNSVNAVYEEWSSAIANRKADAAGDADASPSDE